MKKTVFLCWMLLAVYISVFGINEKMAAGSEEQILSHGTEWRQNHDHFAPDKEMMARINEKCTGDIQIMVYLGLWCHDSEKNVPPFIKILNSLEKKPVVRYFLCERKKNRKVQYYFAEKGIERVPTFVFYRDKKEIGRITENPEKSLLEDFLKIIF